jgi:serine/threonine-protein kinase
MVEHKYRILRRLEAGGMAEVYVGEAEGVQGFKKQVAIKRVLPHLAKNESFIQMFLDEARLSAKLTHANIVQVFDISAREDTYFLIMEFVDGANLKKIMESLHQRGQRMRLSDAAHICSEACRGLSYAHELADETGKALGIVHRDISPPNIMVTKRGEVKVADFGLAKAGTQVVSTDPGVVKGKFSYLSPEAAQGLTVDARADVFSLGIVLWEMLAGRRLFYGQTDYATVKLIQNANIPRLAPLNREVDEEFEEIVLRALAREPERRFQTARAFGDALAGYLFTRQRKVTSYDLANLVRATVSDEKPSAATDKGLIDRLIQDELDSAVEITGEKEALPSLGAGPARATAPGGTPSGGFEDPSSWFSEDGDLMASAPANPPAGVAAPARGAGWRESGVPPAPPSSAPLPPPIYATAPPEVGSDLITLDPDDLQSQRPPAPPAPPGPPAPPTAPRARPAPPAPNVPALGPAEIPTIAKADARPPPRKASTKKATGGLGPIKYVLIAIVAIVAAVVYWLRLKM